MLKGWLIELFEIRRRPEPGVKIILEIASEVDFVERVFFHPLTFHRDLLRAAVAVPFASGTLFQRFRLVFDLLEHRILDHLAIQHFLELNFIERKYAYHLNQPRRQHLPL